MKLKYNIFLITYFVCNLVEDPAPEVLLEQGSVVGKVSGNGEFYEYLGIPYATTNMETRFQPPSPPPKWDGLFRATEEHVGCPQRLFGLSTLFMTGEEDCLKINVYTPANTEKPLPVMVFIHGGGFTMGSGGKTLYGPEFILKHNVLLVTFNYRLGVLGFLCLGIKEAPGNAGLRDQIAALKWIQKNIALFGGDPDNVTIFGESAGAASVAILVTSDAAKGLFKRAIVQSGSSLSMWAINRFPITSARLLAQLFERDTKDPYELYELFRTAPYDVLAKKLINKPFSKYFESLLIHVPCVEKEFAGIERVVKDLPYNLYKSGNVNKVPVMMGFNDKEGIFLISREDEEVLKKRNEGYLFASDLDFPSENEAEEFARKLQEFYFGDKAISKDTTLNLAEVYTDTYFSIPEILETEVLFDAIGAVYNYYFKYSGGRNAIKTLIGYNDLEGATHADDLFYLFKARVWPFWINKEDQVIIDRMTAMWTNFAKYGNPTPKITKELPVKWEPSTKNDMKFLYIDKDLYMGEMPIKKSYNLWSYAYTRFRRKTGNLDN